jgi:hypothetical protein
MQNSRMKRKKKGKDCHRNFYLNAKLAWKDLGSLLTKGIQASLLIKPLYGLEIHLELDTPQQNTASLSWMSRL